jgi:hypothetical protein
MNTYCNKCNECFVFHVFNVKNCINIASLEYFYMMHILMYYGKKFNNLDKSNEVKVLKSLHKTL